MRKLVKFVFSISLLGLLCLMLPGSLRADATYTYVGDPFLYLTGTLPSGLSNITGSLTLANPLGNNYSGTPTLLSYSFSNGATTVNQSDSTIYLLQLSTGPRGGIDGWEVLFQFPPPTSNPNYIWTGDSTTGWVDQTAYTNPTATLNAAYGSAAPGTWTVSTPEPSCLILLLLGTGLLGLLPLAARSKRRAPTASC